MKNLKKFGALLLTLVMMLSLSVTAFAAETYSITIDNAVSGETYTAYKIFDATYTTVGEGDAAKTVVSYTISTSSEWFDTVAKYADSTYDVSAAKVAEYSGNGLTLTQSAGDASVYVVRGTSGTGDTAESLSAPAFAAALDAVKTGKTSAASQTADSSSVTLTVTDPGYYFVDTSLGSLCSLDTTTPTVTIKEKNTAPTITKQVQDDASDDGTTAAAYGDSAVLDVSDIVYYKLTVNTGTKDVNIPPDDTGVDENYVIEDTLPTGFTYTTNSIEIKVGDGTPWNNADYTVDYTNQKLTITLLSTGALKDLAKNTDITITYTAEMTNSQVAIGAAGNTNTVVLTYKNQKPTDSAIVYTYQIGGDSDGTPIIQKIDGTSNQSLAGVKFILSKDVTTGTGDAATTTTYYAKVSEKTTETAGSYYLTGWTTTEADAGAIVTGANGGIEVLGLDAGTYVLTETEALPGYNMLTDTITAVIAANGTVTYKMTSAEGDGSTDPITIINNTGTELPSTGGMGTTIFYIVGGVLVLGAAILLITKRRMNAAK